MEEQPKWSLLERILSEVEQDSVNLNDGEGAPVLIMVSEKRTCSQLKKYITNVDDEHSFLEKLANSFFKFRSSLHKVRHASSMSSNSTAERQQQARQQQQAQQQQQPMMRGRAPPNKRRRVRGGSATAAAASGSGRSTTLAETFRTDVIETVSL